MTALRGLLSANAVSDALKLRTRSWPLAISISPSGVALADRRASITGDEGRAISRAVAALLEPLLLERLAED